jgi:hypothetical protein
LRGAIVSASRLDLDPCQCTTATPRTGTPAAPGLLAPSKRCTSFPLNMMRLWSAEPDPTVVSYLACVQLSHNPSTQVLEG